VCVHICICITVFLDFVNDVVDRILGTFESLPDAAHVKNYNALTLYFFAE